VKVDKKRRFFIENMLNIRKTSSLKKELTLLFQKGISSGLVAKENPLQQGLKQLIEKELNK